MKKRSRTSGKPSSIERGVMLDTVKVPKQFEQIFQKAQEYVSKYFQKKKEIPSKGTIEIFGERYILVRAASMSVDFFETVKDLYKDQGEEESINVARQLLFDIAHAIGKQDARNFHNKMKLKNPIEKLSAGPIHFSHSGWAFVDIFAESKPTPDENYYLIYDHPFSFESDAWERAGKKSDFPVCVMNAGYSSGWCEESFGVPLVASEIMCRAKGDDACRFIMAHPSKIEAYIKDYLKKEPVLAKKITQYEIPGFFKRKEMEEELRRDHNELEIRVKERTAELTAANELLNREIEERKKADEALWIKDSAIESSVYGIGIANLEGHMTYVNQSFLKMWGYDEKEVLGKHLLNFCQKKDEVTVVMEGLSDEGWVGELKARRKDGSLFDVSVSASMVKDRDDNPAYMMFSLLDITIRRQAEEALQESKKKYKNLVELAPDIIITLDSSGRLTFINAYALQRLGYTWDEVIGRGFWEFLAPESIPIAQESFEKARIGEIVKGVETILQTKNGDKVIFELRSMPEFIEGKFAGGMAILRDITERKQGEDTLKKSKARLTEAQRIAHLGNWDWDIEKKELHWSDEIYRIFGLSPQEFGASYEAFLNSVHPDDREFVKQSVNEALSGEKPYSIDHRIVLPDGTIRFVHEEGEVTHDKAARPIRMVGTVQDITERKKMEEKINYLAYYDALTGLPNRTLFVDRLTHVLSSTHFHKNPLAVLAVDIDGFKSINDTHGFNVGDNILKEAGRILSASVREGDTVARLGGDDFGILLTDIAHSKDIVLVVEKIMKNVSQPIKFDRKEILLSITMGISVYPDDGKDAHEMMRNADMALSRAKKGGRKTYQFYTAGMNEEALEFVLLEEHLLNALKNEEFILYYQPYWEINTKKTAGMEALIRWQSKDRGLVSPGIFIPVLEKTGIIIEVGEWIFRTACRQVMEWQNNGRVIPVSVNLSPVQFMQKDLADTLERIIKETGVDPNLLTMEITESAFMHDIEFTSSVLKKLKDIGVSISIDDFGTGYSSLSYLKRFPIDNLKIDISFIREIATDPDTASIVMAIISMAKGLNLKTIAEGVETEEQWKILRLLKCDMGQGYYFSKPLPVEEIENCFK